MSGRRAIVTMAVGQGYAERWRRLCEPNWRAYAERHGLDLICIERPLDDSERAAARSPSWQKLLVCEQPFAAEYERIAWVDADILFGRDAPDLFEGVPADKVGAVDEFDAPTPAVKQRVYGGILDGYYAAAGLEPEYGEVVQAGLLVLSPELHADPLRRVYDDHEDVGLNYEMRPLSHELLGAGLVHWLDPRWNRLWDVQRAHRAPFLLEYPRHPRAREQASAALDEVYGLHFAGRSDEMEELIGPRRVHPAAAPAPTQPPATRTPVAIFVFARPDTTERVLAAVRRARPERLYVIADAPRPDHPEEAELCRRTRALFDDVGWDCEVATDFAEERTTLKRHIESGMDWVFGRAGEAIVLEDDTIPDPTFFPFCDELLEHYRHEERVMSICGANFQFDGPASDDSYYFSRYPGGPGSATWRRAWTAYDPEMAEWPRVRETDWVSRFSDSPHSDDYWRYVLEQTHRDRDHWDRAWLFACWLHGGLHAIPNPNLIANVGFREDGTNVSLEDAGVYNDLPTEPMAFPLVHPPELRRNERADAFVDSLMHAGRLSRVFARLRARKGAAA